MTKLSVRWGSMASGKSAALLAQAFNYNEGGLQVHVLTAHLDTRAGRGIVASRLGIQRAAEVFTPETNFFQVIGALRGIACVLIDEAQFMSEIQALQVSRAVHIFGVPVYAFGLRTDFMGLPFPGMATLLSLADEQQELVAVCACGNKANMNIRIDENGAMVREGERVLIGGNSTYKAVCGKCFHFLWSVAPSESELRTKGFEFVAGEYGHQWQTADRESEYHRSRSEALTDAYRVAFAPVPASDGRSAAKAPMCRREGGDEQHNQEPQEVHACK